MATGLSKLLIVAPALLMVIGLRSISAQIATDGTAGPQVDLTGPDFQIGADLGTRAGRNLFHSFERFSLGAGERATFSGPDQIRNVISRVTGGARSDIDGTIASIIPGADFYFINPAGIAFGSNARLDVQGSLHVSTADELRFEDGARFSASDPSASSFTTAPPETFGFLGAGPAKITVDRSTLDVPQGEGFSIVGGEIEIDGGPDGSIEAEAGRITLAALGGPGRVEVGTGKVTGDGFANVRLGGQALVDASGDGAGLIRIRGGEVVVEDQSFVFADNTGRRDAAAGRGVAIETGSLTVASGSLVTAAALGEGDAGAVTIDATELVEVRAGSQVSSTAAQGDAGDVVVKAGRLVIDGIPKMFTGIASQANESSSGNAGAVTIEATGLVEVREGGQISSSTFAQGNAGKVTVTAERVLVDGSGIASQANEGSSGNAGAVTIDATGLVQVRAGSQVSTTTFAQGDAGKVTVTAERVLVDGDGVLASIGSQADRNSSGNAGAVTIDATGLVEVREGGQISSNTFGTGDAGEVTVEAGRVLVDAQDFGEGGSSSFSTSIGAQAGGRASDTSEPRGEGLGNAGRVTINAAERVDVLNGGLITSLSVGRDAGEVTVTAPVVLIDGAGSTFFTGITSEVRTGSIGNAGIVTVKAREELEIRNSGENRNRGESSISSSTAAQGDAGDVVVKAGRVVIDGIPERFTGIASQANKGSSGNAGTVTVIAETMEVRNAGDVASSSFAEGRAGDVVVRVPQLVVRDDGVIASSGRATSPAGNVRLEVDNLLVANAGIRTVGSGATGGEIVVEADDLIHLVKAEVASNGIEPGARASLITLTAPQIALNDSRVISLTGAGEPLGGSGEARLLGDTTVISTDSEVAASSTVEITGQEADLGSQLVTLEGTFIDTAPLRARCGARRDIGASSFTGVARGGLPPSPDGPLAIAYLVDEALVAEAQKAGLRPTAGTASGDVRLAATLCASLD